MTIINLLQQEEYKVEKVERAVYPEFENINYYGDNLSAFDDLLKSLGRVPTHKEYIQEVVNRSKAFFTDERHLEHGSRQVDARVRGIKVTYSFIWNDLLEKAVIYRASRTYQSFLVEYVTAIQLKEIFQSVNIYMSTVLDGCFGSDLMVMHNNKAIYVHIFSNTKWGNEAFLNKRNRKGVAEDKDGNLHYWTRNWDRFHVPLSFDRYNSETTQVINGNPVFKEEYLKLFILNSFRSKYHVEDLSNPDATFKQFFKWMKDNNIDTTTGTLL